MRTERNDLFFLHKLQQIKIFFKKNLTNRRNGCKLQEHEFYSYEP